MKKIETSILIAASPQKVWSVLMDFERYPSWNPFIKEISGEKKVGGKLTAKIESPGAKPMIFKPTVQSLEEEKEFSWLGRVLLPGIFDGKHIFRLEATSSGHTRFYQEEEFKGFLLPLLSSVLKQAEKGFELMNESLKNQSEQKEA